MMADDAFMLPPDWLSLAPALALATAGAGRASASCIFAAVDRLAAAGLSQTLCTVNRFDADTMRVVRLYSSNPQAYPPGGSKDKAGTAWGEHVLLRRQVFVGEGEPAIRQAFDDHDAIVRLGLRSVINVPVVSAGLCLGTVNYLMPYARLTPEHVQYAQLTALHAIPGFLTARADPPAASVTAP